MVALGAVLISEEHVKPLELELDELCSQTGFPGGEVFKWSPQRNVHWMYSNLVEEGRMEFQLKVLNLLSIHDCKAVFVAEDKCCATAEASSESHEIDVVKLLVERVNWFYSKKMTQGIIICDRPGGGRKEEEKFLAECLDTVREGTSVVTPSTISMAILSCPFRLSRLLQAADLIASATLAYVSGEDTYSPPVVEQIKPLFLSELSRVGGVGVKLHPFTKYVNLYHWLFGDTHYVKYPSGYPLPMEQYAFSKSPKEY